MNEISAKQALSEVIITIGQISAVSKICYDCVSMSSQMDANELGNIGEVLALISKLSSDIFDKLVEIESTVK